MEQGVVSEVVINKDSDNTSELLQDVSTDERNRETEYAFYLIRTGSITVAG